MIGPDLVSKFARPAYLICLLFLMLSACISTTTSAIPVADTVLTSETASLTHTPIPLEPTLIPDLMPEPSPTSFTPAVPSSPSPDDPFSGLRIDDLAARSYGGPGIMVGEVRREGNGFTQYRMRYYSDGLLITGLVDIPDGDGPFPVIIVNHGYVRHSNYRSGSDSWRIADWLAERDYIALMPDYRNYAGSDIGPNPFHIGYAVDVMNLAAQVESLPQAIPQQIGMIGHSMGGEISLWPMVISNEIDAIVLYAAMSGDVGRNWAYALQQWPVQRSAMNAQAMVYGKPEEKPRGYAAVSPINYVDRTRMPVMIHHGMLDDTVPYLWSEELVQELEAVGADVMFHPYREAGHSLSGPNFAMMMERSLDFFETNVRGNVNSPDN